MSAGFTISQIGTAQELDAIVPEWIALWNRCRSTPFQRPEWLLPWLDSFTPSELRITTARRGDRLVGIAPMFIYHRRQERVLAPVGAGITDYLDWLVDPELEAECLPRMMQTFETARWDVMELLDLPSTSPLCAGSIPSLGNRERCDVCPVLRFSEGKSFNQIVPSHQRRNLKTAHNRISRAGSWVVEMATQTTLPEFLDMLIRLHGARWTELGHPGVLADRKVQKFHELSSSLLLASGLLRFYGLRLEERLIAVLHTLVGRDAVYCYLQGFDTAYKEFSPGMLLIEAVIRNALEDGKSGVDFLRGHEAYKYMWGAKDEQTFCIRTTKSCLERSTTSLAA